MKPASPRCWPRRWLELARRAEPAITQRVSSDTPPTAKNTTIYVDADACPVKDEAVRVAERHGLDIHFVSNAFMRLPEGPLIHRVVVADGPDAADDWIAERIESARHRRHRRHSARRALPEKGRRRHRPDRQAVHRSRHRHGAGHARIIGAPARDRREQRLQRQLHQAGSLALPGSARARRAPCARLAARVQRDEEVRGMLTPALLRIKRSRRMRAYAPERSEIRVAPRMAPGCSGVPACKSTTTPSYCA